MGGQPTEVRLRLSRAVAAGFASAGSLAAAAVCVLALVSATLAFRGWPLTQLTEGGGDRVVVGGSVRAPLPGSKPAPAPEPRPLIAVAPPERAGAADAAAPARAGRRRAVSRDRIAVTRPAGSSLGTVRVPPRPPAPPAAQPTPAPTQQPSVVRQTVGAATRQVRETGAIAGREVAKVDPATGRRVEELTGQVAGTLEQLSELLPRR